MIPSIDLFDLIKSMDKQQRRRFREAAKKKAGTSEKGYLRLFNAISVQTFYNETTVKEKLKIKHNPGYFAVLKNYLHNSLIDFIGAGSENGETEEKIRQKLNAAKLLFEKGLYKQSSALIKKWKGPAENYDLFFFALEFIDLEKKIHIELHPTDHHEYHLLMAEETLILKKYENILNYRSLGMQVRSLLRKSTVGRSGKELSLCKKLLNTKFYKDSALALSFEAKTRFYLDKSFLFNFMGQTQKACNYRVRLVQLAENLEYKTNSALLLYYAALINQVQVQSELSKYEEALQTLAKVKAIPHSYKKIASEKLKRDIFSSTVILELSICVASGQYDLGIALAKRTESKLAAMENKITGYHLAFIYFNAASCLFGNGDLRKSLRWLNRIITDKKFYVYEDIYAASLMLNLLAHFALGHSDLLEYTLKTTYNHLEKNNRLHTIEKSLIIFIKEHLHLTAGNVKLKNGFKILLEKVKQISTDPIERKFLDYFDLIEWIESKISNRNFSELVKAKRK